MIVTINNKDGTVFAYSSERIDSIVVSSEHEPLCIDTGVMSASWDKITVAADTHITIQGLNNAVYG